MNIWEINEFIDLVTSKERGGFNTYAEKDMALDRASLTLFSLYRPQYSKSIIAKEALAPFRGKYDYTTNSSGEITLSTGLDFTHLLAMDVVVTDAEAPGGSRRFDVEFPNEDERAKRLRSQTNPVSATSPIADIVGVGWYNLLPAQVHNGSIYYLKRPAKPITGYTQVGRSFTYNPGTSTQLEWTEPYLNDVIFLAIRFLGINLNNEKLLEYMTGFLNEGS